jgi:hypothetical protein
VEDSHHPEGWLRTTAFELKLVSQSNKDGISPADTAPMRLSKRNSYPLFNIVEIEHHAIANNIRATCQYWTEMPRTEKLSSRNSMTAIYAHQDLTLRNS